MGRITIAALCLGFLSASEFVLAQRVKQWGKAIASGDLFFKSTGGGWQSGSYRLMVTHPDAKAELPIELD